MRRKRLWRVLGYTAILIACGIGYGIFVKETGIAVPCMFHLLTGFSCPGCGVTRMCVALLSLDFKTAFYCNQAVFLLLPVMGAVFIPYIYGYIQNGKWKMNRLQTGVLFICIGLLVLFGIVRNILPL